MPPKKTTTKKKQAPAEPREVIRVIEARELIRQWIEAENGGHVEVREHRDGSWTVHYPEAGWLPCEADCKLRHTHVRERPFTQVVGEFESPEDAYEMATQYAGTREIKIVQLEARHRSLPKQMVDCGCCEKQFDMNNTGATFEITPYDKRRKKLFQKGHLCDECADSIAGHAK